MVDDAKGAPRWLMMLRASNKGKKSQLLICWSKSHLRILPSF